MLKLYICDTSKISEETYDRAYNKISKDRRKKADKIKSVQGKKNCVFAEILLRKGLVDLSLNYNDFKIQTSKEGKPFFLNHNNLFFNISHSKDVVICALSDKEVGVDVEQIREVDFKIAKRFFTMDEFNLIKSREDFFDIWTKKESFAKYLGESVNTVLGKKHTDYKAEFVKLSDIKGYICTVCSKEIKAVDIVEFSEVI